MSDELSAKDKKLKAQMEAALSSPDVTWLARGRRFFGMLPTDPRCASCLSPFEGLGGAFARNVMNRKRSDSNPLFCTLCENSAKRTRAGVEVEMSMLFADIRGSTPLAESMSNTEFMQLIDRFYTRTTRVLTHSLAMIDKLAGDQVTGFYIPGYVGKEYAARAVAAAREILLVTGHADAEGPWAPVGVGVNTGEAYFGVVGRGDESVQITGLGDEVNVAARLASNAAAGEIVLSESTAQQARLDTAGLEKRTVELKGKSQPIDVWVMKVGQSTL
jgi:adenylate cyclase